MTRQIQTPGAPQDTIDITRDQLRAQLDALGITYTTRDTKPELQAKLDAAQSAPDQPKNDQPPAQGEPDYPAIIADYQQRIFELTTENAELRAKIADREGVPVTAAKSAPVAQKLTGMVLTDQGYVVG